MNTATAFKVLTPEGNCYAVFPDDALHCDLKGYDPVAISYFEDRIHNMFKPHGYPIVLADIEPESFLKYCHRPDLGIHIEVEFNDEEYDMLTL